MFARTAAPRARRCVAAFALLSFVGLLGLAAPVSSAALASVTGGGYSGALSSNPSVRKQQLICDPTGTLLSGMTSVKYDPSVVALTGLDFAHGFAGSGAVEVRGQVSVKLSNGCWGKAIKTFLQPLSSFLTCPQGQETGYVQVYYKSTGAAQPMCPPAGYKTLDSAGPDGTDTHDLMFTYRSGVKDTASADYTIYADSGNRPSGNGTDFLTGVAKGKVFTLCPAQLAPASVSASLVACPKKPYKDDHDSGRGHADLLRAGSPDASGANAVPLPPAAWTGLATLAGLVLFGFRRRPALS